MNKQTSYTVETLKFKVQPRVIDYFKLHKDYFKTCKRIIKQVIPLAPNEHLSVDNHFRSIDPKVSETVVVNIQVGKGKTTACYELISRYVDTGHKVIVVSPFKKLVDKDYEAIKSKGIEAFNYSHLPEKVEGGYSFTNIYEDFLEKPVQVMTINCLLQNPGEDRYEQAFVKRDYLGQLIRYCKRHKDSKVVMFFDEVHESMENFHSEFIPNIARWKDLVHKCFISSATFTPASIPVIEYITYLTGGVLNILEVPRVQVANPASLHLHFTEQYSGSNIDALDHLKTVVQQCMGAPVHILTGYKATAQALVNKGNVRSSIADAITKLNPNIVTSDTDKQFDPLLNNIGTTFKTGVDIKELDATLIIILPPVTQNNSKYGIFNDGIPSIIQALARIRHTGDIHVFLTLPQVITGLDANSEDIPYLLRGRPSTPSKSQNDLYDIVVKKFLKVKGKRYKEIYKLTKYFNRNESLYTYPSVFDYLVEDVGNFLVKNHVQYGSMLSPYLFWAAMNNQFTNAILKQVTYTSRRVKHVPITDDTAVEAFESILSEETLAQCKKVSLRHHFQTLFEQLEFHDHINSKNVLTKEVVRFDYQGKLYPLAGLGHNVFFKKGIVDLYLKYRVDQLPITKLSKEDYILSCILQARSLRYDEARVDARKLLYYKLSKCYEAFLLWFERQVISDGKRKLVHKGAYLNLPTRIVEIAWELVMQLNDRDRFINEHVYPFLSNSHAVDLLSKQRAIYKEFKKCFTRVASSRTSFQGVKEYYFVENNIRREPLNDLDKVDWL